MVCSGGITHTTAQRERSFGQKQLPSSSVPLGGKKLKSPMDRPGTNGRAGVIANKLIQFQLLSTSSFF